MKIATLKIAVFLLAISFTNCYKDEAPLPPLQQLPPMTQVGANTVGCLVNGEAFLPKGSNPTGSPIVTCFYQFLDGNYEFGLGFNNNEKKPLVRRVSIQTNKLKFTEGQTYDLKAETSEDSAYAYFILGGNQYGYGTTNTFTGELTITKLDPTKAIISGTFWFDAKRANTDEVIKIRDGRFDMQYSQ
ncbi:conserved exported protein of unknown function [Tenacibaculum sp. 190524A02b]|uniref:DUF6252 family protein n=1 Tax=Tenacibaculum vairaonense TaxID=3137860 RepID=UPI0032B1E720